MKKLKLLFITVLLFSFGKVMAQDAPEIEYSNILYYWNKTDNSVTETDKESAKIKGGGFSVKYIFNGETSNTNIKSQDKISFLISTDQANALTMAKLYKMTIKKGKRSFKGVTMGLAKADMDGDGISFRSKKVKDGLYELVPDKKLEPGEYAVNGLGYNIAFLFTIK